MTKLKLNYITSKKNTTITETEKLKRLEREKCHIETYTPVAM
jgi:hypothetical protein